MCCTTVIGSSQIALSDNLVIIKHKRNDVLPQKRTLAAEVSGGMKIYSETDEKRE